LAQERFLVVLPGWLMPELLYVHDASSPSVLRPPSNPAGRSERPRGVAQPEHRAWHRSRASEARLVRDRGAERSEHHRPLIRDETGGNWGRRKPGSEAQGGSHSPTVRNG